MKYVMTVLLLFFLVGCSNDSETLNLQMTQLSEQVTELSATNQSLEVWIQELEDNIKLTSKELSLSEIEVFEWKEEFSNQVLAVEALQSELASLQSQHDALIEKYNYLKSISDFNNETEFRKELLDQYITDPLMDVYMDDVDIRNHLEKILIDNRTVFVPADADKGFEYPYILYLPTLDYFEENEQYNRYLLIYPQTSEMSIDPFDSILNYDPAKRPEFIRLAEEMWSPVLIPLFPSITLEHKTDLDILQMQSLSRGSILAWQNEHLLYQRTDNDTLLSEAYYDTLLRVDVQLNHMITDAMDQLDTYGYQVQNQVMMFGELEAGLFVQRFSMIYPDLVKAYFASNAVIPPVPTNTYFGTSLTYPLGIADFPALFGFDFDLTAYNQVAKINMIGDDTLNPLDIVLDLNIRTKINNVYDDSSNIDNYWESVSDLYFSHDGEGMFIMNNQGEGVTTELDYRLLKEFFQMNRDALTPLYPTSIPYGSYTMRTK